MFEEPEEEDSASRPFDPKERAQGKSDEFRMHAELCAVFEGNRKFDAAILTDLNGELARESQRTIGKLEKSRAAETPLIQPEMFDAAAAMLDLPAAADISTNDYHIHRRPGEVMIMRWLAGEQVESFYTRLQAHFDFARSQFTEDERQSHGWKQDPQTTAYLAALDAIEIKMEEKYLRPVIREHGIYVLSTHATDEMDISHLCDFIMGVPAAEVVGEASAPGDVSSEQDRAWFFKLFALRGMKDDVEQMCFFTYMQKTDDSEF